MKEHYETKMNNLIFREVKDILQKLITDVVDAVALSGTHRYYHKLTHLNKIALVQSYKEPINLSSIGSGRKASEFSKKLGSRCVMEI